MDTKYKHFPVLILFLMLCLTLSISGCSAGDGAASESVIAVSDDTESDAYVADSVPESVSEGMIREGEYQVSVTLEGGSGKASVNSPTVLRYTDNQWILELRWSSSNYDYMIVGDEKYLPVSIDGGSLFEIPLDEPVGELAITADTTAMGTPHEIEYTLVFGPADADAEEAVSDDGNGTDNISSDNAGNTSSGITVSESVALWRSEHGPVSQMELRYATGFSVDRYEDGSSLVVINDSGDAFFLLPEDGTLPDDIPDDITVLKVPLGNIYLSTSGAMDMFRAMGALDAVRFTSTDISGWDMPEVIDAMEQGNIIYVGKYSTPDYERLLAGGCSLAVENTMIYHAPEAGEQLAHLGIPVLVDYTSYENEPLGRCEWIKLYGLLCGREEEAEAAFSEQEALFLDASSGEPTDQTVAFFYITQSGLINVRRSNDYLARMINMAGGDYIFHDFGSPDANSPNISLQMEEFYADAKEADILIYNGSMEGEIYTMDEFTSMNPLLAKFRAVGTGNVFCARKSMYQASMEMGTILSDLRAMMTGEDEKLVYFYRLK